VETELAIALSARDWPDRLRRFLADHGGARVRVAAMGPEDLLAEAYHVLLIDDICSFLTPRLVELVSKGGRAVVGVYDPSEFADGKDRLLECGVADVVEAGATPDEFLEVIDRLSEAIEGVDDRTAAETPTPSDEPSGHPTVIVVGGPPGGTGATEVSVALASILGGWRPTVLVDGDDNAPAVAQRLALPLYPNLRTALDVLEHRTGSLERVLHTIRGERFLALPGLANVRDWSEVRPRQILDVVRELSLTRTFVVVDAGSQLESEGDGFGRHGMSRALIAAADRLVAVGLGTPVGVARLLEWLAGTDVMRGGVRSDVFVNRAPVDRFRRGELIDEITRTYQPASFTFVPDDRRVQSAGWDGAVLARGRFRRAVERWAARYAGVAR
jgi:MinD-like ATPase involved in chromosome partitioning or flagellar assembly